MSRFPAIQYIIIKRYIDVSQWFAACILQGNTHGLQKNGVIGLILQFTFNEKTIALLRRIKTCQRHRIFPD